MATVRGECCQAASKLGVCPVTRLQITPVGRRVATSGLRPVTAHYLIDYNARLAEDLLALVTARSEQDQTVVEKEDLEFAFFFAALTSPEYAARGDGGRRFIPWQITGQLQSDRGRRLDPVLSLRPWDRDGPAANAADMACDWIAGVPLRELEDRFADLRGGALRGLFRELAQVLFGWAEVLNAATAPSLHEGERATALQEPEPVRDALRAVTSIIRMAAIRLEAGLPEEALWIHRLESNDGRRLLTRPQIVALSNSGLIRPDDLMDRGRTSDIIAALRPEVGNNAADLAREIRENVEQYRVLKTDRIRQSQLRRLQAGCHDIAERYYAANGTEFEDVLDEILRCVEIEPDERDGPGKTSFPDFVLSIPDFGPLVIECKSTNGINSVNFNDATDVIRKAAVHGHEDAFKVTVCKPYMSPDVARKLGNCRKLSVVNAEDMAEVLVRLANNKGSPIDFGDWCSQNGFISAETFVTAVPPTPDQA